MRSWKSVGSLVLAGILGASVWAAPPDQAPPPAPYPGAPRQAQGPEPGMVNYIEGQASINGQAVNQGSIGSARLQAGQSLATQNGRAEVLLSPGAMLRVDS